MNVVMNAVVNRAFGPDREAQGEPGDRARALLAADSLLSIPRRSRLHHSRRRSAGGRATFASWRTTPVARDPDITVPTAGGEDTGRYYRPRQAVRARSSMPVCHRDGNQQIAAGRTR